jgi:DNA-binding NarL/FixJ family response regulator
MEFVPSRWCGNSIRELFCWIARCPVAMACSLIWFQQSNGSWQASWYLISRYLLGPEVKQENAWDLTPRELQILRLIVSGKAVKEIADLLGISVNTVSAHRTRIGRTLKCRNNAELVAFAFRNGLVQIP